MNKESIRKVGMGKRKGSDREKLRMVVYGMVSATILLYLVFGGDKSAPIEQLPIGRIQTPREYQPLADVNIGRLSSVQDGNGTQRAVLEPAPLQHLVEQASKLVYGDMQQLDVKAVDREELLADTEAWRGRPVWVLGTLQWYEADTFTEPHSWRGEILDKAGRTWLFQVVSLPGAMIVGDVVRLSGFFLKHHDMLRPERSFASGPLVVGEELLPSAFRIEPVTELSPKMFRGIQDYNVKQASRPLDSLPFFRLLSYVQNTSADETFGPEEEREPTYAKLLVQNQDQWRGEPVTIRGNLLHVGRTLLGPEGENPLGTPYVWDMWLLNNTGGPTHVVMLDEPVGFEGGRDMLVDVDGFFLRRQVYENANNQVMLASVLVGARVREFVLPEDTLTPMIHRLVLGIGMALLLLIFVAQLRENRLMARARVRAVARKKKLIALPGTLQRLGRRGEAAQLQRASAPPASGPQGSAEGNSGSASFSPGIPPSAP